ncbi:DUF1289 domain-containing protein [Thalassotalea euphylliae]|uniref:DUF1289 domain-containing protein n=1 Tax=Thalassotalea euphylliae TaxID=1655234 RepID=A0A3E0TNS0_9GAMM|nr:DUF1289 domain-containing protein [Thalassotalea euphylliae]REL25930.1 DUF1289 domain-containing protein [Thalassotalea euphylliae]
MQLEFFDVPSPCVGVCQSDDKGHCKGCFRTREERQQWISLSSDDKQKVIKRCVQRKKRKDKAKQPIQPSPDTISTEQTETIVQPSLLDPQPKHAAPKQSTSSQALSSNEDMDFGDFEL